jgi:hypothetical protein
MLFSTGMSFAFWASSVDGNEEGNNSTVSTGLWYQGTPIYTTQEFIAVITQDGNTGTYTLARDINFNNITPAEWTQTKDVRFMGTFDGNGFSIQNVNLTGYRGIFGVLDSATIKNLTLDGVSINYNTGDTYTSGILAGRLQGTNNLIENIRVLNSSVSNTTWFSGGLIGYAAPLSGTGTATFNNIKVQNTSISGSNATNTYGNGGIIGTASAMTMTMNDIYVEATITSSTANSVGGIVGATLTGTTININRAVIYASERFRALANDTNVYVGGIVGRNQGTMSATDVMLSGQLDAYVTNNTASNWTTRVGVLRGIGNNLTFTNVRSSQITLYRNATNPAVLVNSSTLYNKMSGQKPTYSTTVYIASRNTLTTT